MKILYEHQLKMVDESRSCGRRSILLQAPTGSGKSVIASYIVWSALSKGSNTWFIVPRRELMRQMSRQYIDFNIGHTFIGAGLSYEKKVNNVICSLPTLIKRLDTLTPPKLAIIDETHYGSEGLDTVIKWLRKNNCYILGLSATPCRSDGRGLGMWYDYIVEGPSIRWLINHGFLSEYKLFAPDKIDLSGIKTVAGDYAKGELAGMMENNRVLIGNAVKHYKQAANGMRGVTFTTSRKHSEIVCEAYNSAGVKAACIDGNTPEDERIRLARALANKEILQLVNVDLLTFGYDLASAAGVDVTIECMSDLRPTKSLALQMQKWGRVLRKKNMPAIIFDHANNTFEHGLPCDERDWTLSDREKKTGNFKAPEIPVKTCTNCFYTHKPAPSCPNCGFVYPILSREIEEVDGDLVEINTAAIKKKERMEVGRSKNLAELLEIEKKRGYKKGWAYLTAKRKGIVK